MNKLSNQLIKVCQKPPRGFNNFFVNTGLCTGLTGGLSVGR